MDQRRHAKRGFAFRIRVREAEGGREPSAQHRPAGSPKATPTRLAGGRPENGSMNTAKEFKPQGLESHRRLQKNVVLKEESRAEDATFLTKRKVQSNK